MRDNRIWAEILGVENTVVETVNVDEDSGCVVVAVRPKSGSRSRCGVCRRRSPRYDSGDGRRRWRALDAGLKTVLVEAAAPRVSCRAHGVVATHCAKSAVCELMTVAWRTVGSIIDRVWTDTEKRFDRFAGLRRIGIDEISYKKGHKYLTVVVDHDSGRLVWAAEGRNAETPRAFFDLLGPERSAEITHVTADAAAWIAKVVVERCPAAIRCADPFHVVAWATDAVDKVRRGAWNRARDKAAPKKSYAGPGRPAAGTGTAPDPHREHAAKVKKSRWSLLKNPENLTAKQKLTLRQAQLHDRRLYRAYLLKEELRLVFQLPHEEARDALGRWVSWARRCRIPRVREAAALHRQARGVDPRGDRARSLERPDRVGEHEDPVDHPGGFRVPNAGGSDRVGDARAWWSSAATSRKKRPTDRSVEPHFDTGASNGPVEAINGRLEHLRGIALGFRNLTHYILRSLIHSGQLQERIKAL